MDIVSVTAEELRIALSGVQTLPIEQTMAWGRFARSQGNPAVLHLLWQEGDAVLAGAVFYRYNMKGMKFLWARSGPVWMKAPSPTMEAEALEKLRLYLRRKDKSIVFVRLHADYWHPDLQKPIRVIPFDRTVIIDGAKGKRDTALAALPSRGKRTVKRAMRNLEKAGGTIQEETGLSAEQFQEFYDILVEAADRHGFAPHPQEYYWSLLNELGPKHARLFSLRLDGKVAAWDLVLVSGKRATAFFGATGDASRTSNTAPLLDFEVACMLGEEWIDGLDLMGIHSARAPELYDVGRYKLQFSNWVEEVPGVWDLPLHSALYFAVVKARNARSRVRELIAR